MAGFSAEQLQQLDTTITRVFHREMLRVGLAVSDDNDAIEARKDYSFVRALRLVLNSVAAKIGWAVIAVVLGGVFWIGKLGLEAWRAATGS